MGCFWGFCREAGVLRVQGAFAAGAGGHRCGNCRNCRNCGKLKVVIYYSCCSPYSLQPTPPTPETQFHNPYLASTFRKMAQASAALSAKLANSKNRFNSLRNKFLSTSKASRFKFAGVTMVSNKVAYSFPG